MKHCLYGNFRSELDYFIMDENGHSEMPKVGERIPGDVYSGLSLFT